jgi:hypothetical protein
MIPFGNMMRLPDGRVLRKNANGIWIDQMTGSQYNPQTMRDLMYSANTDVPDGGRGKSTPKWVIGVAGSTIITQWLNDTKNNVDSLDFAWIGDSNVAKVLVSNQPWLPNGFVDNFVWAGISAGMRMYGTPVVPAGGPFTANSSSQNAAGYYSIPQNGIVTSSGRGWTSGVLGGPSEFANQFGVSLGNFSPLGGNAGISDFGRAGYAWVGSGSTAYGNGNNWYIGNTGGITGLDVTNNLNLRIIAGTTGNTGGVLSLNMYDSTGARIMDKWLNIGITGGFTAYGVTFPSTSMGNTAIQIYFAGAASSPGFYATGPIAIAITSLYNPVKGIASSTLHECAGQSLGEMWRSVSLAGISANNDTVVNYLKEYYNRQRIAGGSGRVCVAIEGGVNFDNGTSLANKGTNGANYIQSMISFVTSEWSRANLPSNKLTFLVFNTWEQDSASDWNTIYPTISNSMINYANTKNSNVTYVNIFKLGGTFAGLTANGYYNTGETGHLSARGYIALSQNIMDALLKAGRNTYKG